jgi:hypothetical protein
MTTVVISQPMFFPWVGLLEQIRLADVLVHYDDVQFSKGSFTNRVQIKTSAGTAWLTVPLRDVHLGQRIAEVAIAPGRTWHGRHLGLLEQAYRGAPFRDEMLGLVQEVYGRAHDGLGRLAVDSTETMLRYFGIATEVRPTWSSELAVPGAASPRVLDVVKRLGGDRYVTGHGARNYLEHASFEAAGVAVEYLDYRRTPYRQLHGDFTPYVSALDLIANEGRGGARVIASTTVGWREFLARAA